MVSKDAVADAELTLGRPWPPMRPLGSAVMAELREPEAGAEARRQRAAAAKGMDLSKPDRAALDLLLARTASGPLHG